VVNNVRAEVKDIPLWAILPTHSLGGEGAYNFFIESGFKRFLYKNVAYPYVKQILQIVMGASVTKRWEEIFR